MNYGTLSPSGCAAEVLEEILKLSTPDEHDKETLRRLIRQKVRLVIEHCARVAEDYVPVNDLNERLTGIEVGDAIAEALRQLADERTQNR
jgi:hypothetical protein